MFFFIIGILKIDLRIASSTRRTCPILILHDTNYWKNHISILENSNCPKKKKEEEEDEKNQKL